LAVWLYADPVEFFEPKSNTTATAFALRLKDEILASRNEEKRVYESLETLFAIMTLMDKVYASAVRFVHSLGRLVIRDVCRGIGMSDLVV